MIGKQLTKALKKPLFFVLFLVLALTASFFRFYRLTPLTTFLDDQGRDVLKAAQILKEGKIPFIGPMASIGNLYLGPIYYWMITPFLWLWHFDPVGPVVLVAILSLLANIFLFLFALEYFGLLSAFGVSLLYALSPLILQNSRFSWNPNPMPFFSLLWFWMLLKFLEKNNRWFLFGAGVALGVLIQLHYVTGVLFIFTFLAYIYWFAANKNLSLKSKLLPFLFLLLGIILPLIPFILFEVKNCFINTRAAWSFIFGEKEPSSSSWWFSLKSVFLLFADELFFKAPAVRSYLVLTLLLPLFFLKTYSKKNQRLLVLQFSVFAFGLLVAIMVIKGEIHFHYLGFLNPFVFLFIGALISLLEKRRLLNILHLLLLLFLVGRMFTLNNQQIIKAKSNHQIERSRLVADYIARRATTKNIYVTSLTGSPYAYNFRYFLYLNGYQTDSLKPSSVFAICEGPCNPEGHALWEIAQFGVLKTVSGEHVAHGVWVYELKQQEMIND